MMSPEEKARLEKEIMRMRDNVVKESSKVSYRNSQRKVLSWLYFNPWHKNVLNDDFLALVGQHDDAISHAKSKTEIC